MPSFCLYICSFWSLVPHYHQYSNDNRSDCRDLSRILEWVEMTDAENEEENYLGNGK